VRWHPGDGRGAEQEMSPALDVFARFCITFVLSAFNYACTHARTGAFTCVGSAGAAYLVAQFLATLAVDKARFT
jgi:phosphoserine phosphatase